MVKYRGRKPALIGKSSLLDPAESLGHWLEARVGKNRGKCVRERIKCIQAINESGTAAMSASCTEMYERRFFIIHK